MAATRAQQNIDSLVIKAPIDGPRRGARESRRRRRLLLFGDDPAGVPRRRQHVRRARAGRRLRPLGDGDCASRSASRTAPTSSPARRPTIEPTRCPASSSTAAWRRLPGGADELLGDGRPDAPVRRHAQGRPAGCCGCGPARRCDVVHRGTAGRERPAAAAAGRAAEGRQADRLRADRRPASRRAR